MRRNNAAATVLRHAEQLERLVECQTAVLDAYARLVAAQDRIIALQDMENHRLRQRRERDA